ncbi:MAG: helix-turn-helix domain-containing protein [Chthoniobacterales bacterium]
MSCRVRKANKRQSLARRNSRNERRPSRARSWRDRLYDWRERNDFSQTEAALKLQISPRTLQEWEQGRGRPRHLALIAINKIIDA